MGLKEKIGINVLMTIVIICFFADLSINIKIVSLIYFNFIFILISSVNINNIPCSRFFRHLAVYLAMLIPSIVFGDIIIKFNGRDVLYGIVLGNLFVFLNIRDIKKSLNKENFRSKIPIRLSEKYISILLLLVLACIEEFFFRATINYLLLKELKFVSILITSILFTISHYMHPYSKNIYNKKSYVYQFLLGIGLSFLYINTESILGCMIAHLIFNFWKILLILKRPIKKNTEIEIFNDY